MLARLIYASAIFMIAALPARAQTVDVSVLINDPGSAGCDVTPTGLPTIGDVNAQLTATVDRLAAQVINVDLSVCAGATFGPPTSVGGGQPLGNDNGFNGADVVEMSVPRAMVTPSGNSLRVAAVADNGVGVDATSVGALGAPVTAVPGPGVIGLSVLALLILALAWVALRRQRVLMSLLLVGLSFAVLAMNFMVDGQVGDWSSVPPVALDPPGDGTNGETAVDIVALFAGQEDQGGGLELFFRVDMSDLIINNQLPIAADDNLATDEDNPVAGDLFADNGNGIDSDPDSDPFAVTMVAGTATVGAAVSLPSGAQVTVNADGTFSYDPLGAFNALSQGQITTDAFTYTIDDAIAGSDQATATVTITGVNDVGTAVDDSYNTGEDTPLNQAAPGVLGNDSDADTNDTLTTVLDTGPTSALSFSLNPDGSFSYTPALNFNGTDSFTYHFNDGFADSNVATATINVGGVNDPPVGVDDMGDATDEDTPITTQNVLTNDTDVDLDPLSVLTVDAFSAQGAAITDNGDGTFNYDPTASATLNALSVGQMVTDTFNYTVTDGFLNDTATVSVDVTGVNDPMTANDDGGAGFATDEDTSFTTGNVLSNDTDPDAGDTLSVMSVDAVSAQGAAITDLGNGTFTYDPTGAAALQALAAGAMVTDTFSYTGSDGNGSTDTATVSIDVSGINDDPVIAFPTGGAVFNNLGPVNLDPAATLTDVDSPNFDTGDLTASVALSANTSMCDVNDSLIVENQGMGAGQIGFDGLNLSFESTVFGTVTTPYLCSDLGGGLFDIQPLLIAFDPNASIAAVTALLRAMQYTTGSADDQDREASAMVTDGDGGTSNAALATITVNLNQAPVITSDGGGATASVNAAENQTAVTTVTATDADIPAQTLTFSITGGADQALFGIGAASGVLTFNSAPDFEAPTDAGANNVYDVQVTVTDDGTPNLSDAQDIAVTVTDVNEAPTITSDGGGATASVNAAENQTAVTTVTATDVDLPAQTLTFSVTGGADQALFGIGAASGVLTFNSAPDFENPIDAGANNVYDVQVTVTDNGVPNLSDVQDIAVTVTNTNDAPVITSDGGGATASVNAAENQIAVTTTTATDSDLPAQTLTFSISGGADQALFGIGAASGVLTFNAAPDFENPIDAGANNVYDVQVTVTDNGAPNLSDVQDIAVTVTNTNDAPVITSDGGGATAMVNAAENQTAVTTVTATDEDLPAQTLTFSITGGADQALFGIGAGSGVLTFNAAPDFENPTDAGANNVYDVQVTVTDNGAPNLSDSQDIAVTVTNTNDAPVITSDGGGATAMINAAENQTAVTTTTATDEDLPAQTLTFSITGGADQALFGIGAGSGVLTFNTPPNFEAPGDAGADGVYDVQVTVTDNGAPNLSDVQDIAVTVTNINDAPVITSDGGGATAMVNFDEEQVPATPVTTVTATDADLPAQTLTFSITGGADQALFGIVAGTGVLTFNSAPDFENPTDAGMNNIYDVQVTVTDNGAPNLSDVQDIAVTVNDVNEAPTAMDESFDVQSNVGIQPAALNGILANETDPDAGDTVSLVAAFVGTFATTAGGSITTAADGSFTYTPQAGDAGVADTFAYDVRDVAGLTDSATVTFNVDSNTIWFVDLIAGGGGDGTLSTPFDSLLDLDDSGANPDANGHTLFVYTSDASTQTDNLGGVDFDPQPSQLLIGEGVAGAGTINTFRSFTTHPHSLSLPAIGGPNHTISAGSGITLSTNNTIRGLDVGGAAGISGTGFGTLTIDDVGIGVTANILFLSTGTVSDPTPGDFTFSTLSSSSGSGIVLNTVGGSFTVNGTTSITGATLGIDIDSTPAGGSFDFGATTIGGGTTAGIDIDASGSGTFTFDSLSVTNGTGIGLSASTGGTLNIAGTMNTISSSGPGIDITSTSLGSGATFSSVSSSGSSGDGINLDSVTGSLTINGGSITGSSTIAFDVNAGSSNVTYNGTITNTSDRSVEVTNRMGGTVQFGGLIDDDGTGIALATNPGSTINFRGGMALDTGANTAFSATGGGTVEVCATNDCAAGAAVVNTIGTSATPITATGINIANTTIGANGVTFRSIDVNGAANGIVLNATGSSGGGFTITGVGASTSPGNRGNVVASAGTGGTLTTTGDAVSLNDADLVTLRSIDIPSPGDDGISAVDVNGLTLENLDLSNAATQGVDGIRVVGFTLANSEITSTGNANEENGLDFGEETGSLQGLTGTALIVDSTIDGAAESGMEVRNFSGSLSMTITNTRFANNQAGAFGEELILFSPQASASMTVLIDGAGEFVNCRNQCIDATIGAAAGDSALLNLTVDNVSFNNYLGADGMIKFEGFSAGESNLSVLDSNFTPVGNGRALFIKQNNNSDVHATVQGNTITGNDGVNFSRAIEAIQDGPGTTGNMFLQFGGTGAGQGNTITGYELNAIFVDAREATSTAQTEHHIIIENNNVTMSTNAGAFPGSGIRVDSRMENDLIARITGNTVPAHPNFYFEGGAIVITRQNNADFGLQNVAGNTDAQAISRLNADNTLGVSAAAFGMNLWQNQTPTAPTPTPTP